VRSKRKVCLQHLYTGITLLANMSRQTFRVTSFLGGEKVVATIDKLKSENKVYEDPKGAINPLPRSQEDRDSC